MRSFAICAAASTFLATISANPSTFLRKRAVWDFADIPATKNVQWIPCYEKYTCTNLEVPLDYKNATAGSTSIAFIRYNGANSTGQDILVNPGGPGTSGISYIRTAGDQLLNDFGHQYNLVSFDPRGVNNSGPPLTCYPGSPTNRLTAYIVSSGTLTVPNSEQFQRAYARGERCTAENANTAAKYVGTSAVAQDVLYFTQLQAKARGQSPDKALLWYYGISYGTILGQTFAALYPSKVGRMILDGSVYGTGWYAGDFSSWIETSDDAVRTFFEYCIEAGPQWCAYAAKSTTARDIESRTRNLLTAIDMAPNVIADITQPIPQIITRPMVERYIIQKLYTPIGGFQAISQALYALENGNGTDFLSFENLGASAPNPNYDLGEARSLINCVDVNSRWKVTSIASYENIVSQFKNISFYGGAYMAQTNQLACVGGLAAVFPPASQVFSEFNKVRSHTPVFFVNSNKDPVTPLSSAVKNSAYFSDSVVLVQNTTGHGVFTVPSSCTIRYLQKYLADASLPMPNTVCQGDAKPSDYFTTSA